MRRMRRAALVRGARGRGDGSSCSSRSCATRCARSTSTARRIDVDLGFLGSRLDVFTLFPQWFDWFRTQRHVRNALARGHALERVDYRATTTLSGRAVDDTPFGGGAGMVLRVDVMEGALRAATASIRSSCATQRRVIALTPGGRLLDDALASRAGRGARR